MRDDLRSFLSPIDLIGRSPDNIPGAGSVPVNPDPGFDSPAFAGAVSLVTEQLQRILRSNWKYGKVLQKAFTVGTNAETLLPEDQSRRYLFILNISTVNQLWIGFDVEPNPAAFIGLPLAINFGFYEPLMVPTNQIYIAGGAAGTNGICIYSSEGN